MKGKLTLIPTPIDENSILEPGALKLLDENWDKSILLVEEAKANRRSWLRWGLPREAIEKFILYNEHTQENLNLELIKKLQKGENIFLLSDCGLPAFCDPGQELVNLCHQHKIEVSATSFANSISLAIALSGFDHSQFFFAGFPPRQDREAFLTNVLKRQETIVLMDTPYRLRKLLEELDKLKCQREVFLGMNLNQPSQKLVRGSIGELLKRDDEKEEFILLIDRVRK